MLSKLRRIVRYELPLYLVLLITNVLPDFVFILRLRGALARPFLGSCGKNLRLGRNITFYNPSQINIGDNVYIAYGNWFSAAEKIKISNEVIIGPNSVFSSSNHTKKHGSFRYGEPVKKPIVVGDGTWIAGNCSIVSGVKIGKGVLVAANSVVNKNVENDVMVAGVPANTVKKI